MGAAVRIASVALLGHHAPHGRIDSSRFARKSPSFTPSFNRGRKTAWSPDRDRRPSLLVVRHDSLQLSSANDQAADRSAGSSGRKEIAKLDAASSALTANTFDDW